MLIVLVISDVPIQMATVSQEKLPPGTLCADSSLELERRVEGCPEPAHM